MAITVNSGSEVKEVNYNDDAVFQLKLNNELVWSRTIPITIYESSNVNTVLKKVPVSGRSDPKSVEDSNITNGGHILYGDDLYVQYNITSSVSGTYRDFADVPNVDYYFDDEIIHSYNLGRRVYVPNWSSAGVNRTDWRPVTSYQIRSDSIRFNNVYHTYYPATSNTFNGNGEWIKITLNKFDFNPTLRDIVIDITDDNGAHVLHFIPKYTIDYAYVSGDSRPPTYVDAWYAGDAGSHEDFYISVTGSLDSNQVITGYYMWIKNWGTRTSITFYFRKTS